MDRSVANSLTDSTFRAAVHTPELDDAITLAEVFACPIRDRGTRLPRPVTAAGTGRRSPAPVAGKGSWYK